MDNRQTKRRHALREPMVWLVIVLPTLVVIAGIVTLVVAIRAGGNDAVPDAVQRTAQVQVAELGPEARARAMGLSAVLRVRDDRIELLPVSGAFERGRPLTLQMTHPIRAEDDHRIVLAPDAQGWSAQATLPTRHDWQLRLEPADTAWRLHGRLPAGQAAARLASTLH